jgi:hypothetical protein
VIPTRLGARPAVQCRSVMSHEQLSSTNDFPRWRAELLRVGRIVQDDDHQTPEEERVRDFHRYLELVDGLDGSEGVDAIAALFESIQVPHDYGAYQAANHAIWRFPADQFAVAFVSQLPRLIESQPEWASEFMWGLAGSAPSLFDYITAFNEQLARSPENIRSVIADFIRGQAPGWPVDDRCKGRLGPGVVLDRKQIEAEAAAEQAERDRVRQKRADRQAEADARITDRRCASCGKPCPSYRRTCKYCGAPGK